MLRNVPVSCAVLACAYTVVAGVGSTLEGVCFDDDAFQNLGSLQLLQTSSAIHRVRLNQDRQSSSEGVALPSPATHEVNTTKQAVQGPAASTSAPSKQEVSDMDLFLWAFIFSGLLSAAFVGVFTLMKSVVPEKYDGNIRSGVIDMVMPPIQRPEGPLGWLHASLALTTEQVQECTGLDNAMLLEFTILGMKVCLGISVPVVIIMCPLNFLLGGGRPDVHDTLSRISIANVSDHNGLFWVYTPLVWGVVSWTVYCVNQAQAAFLMRRRQWLKNQSPARATTLLTENIPKDYRSDAQLKEFFDRMFPGTVQSAYVVRQTNYLLYLIETRKEAVVAIKRAEVQWAKDGHTPETEPMVFDTCSRTSTPSIEYYKKAIVEVEGSIRTERDRILKESEIVGSDVLSDKGFVRFKNRRARLIAQNVQYTYNHTYWRTTVAPPAEDIRWYDLQLSRDYERYKDVAGYACLALVFVGFTLAVILCTNIAEAIYLGPLQPLWITVASAFGVNLVLSFLPLCFITVFRTFFALKAERWAQRALQDWYWWFMLLLIVVVTPIGTTIIHFAAQSLGIRWSAHFAAQIIQSPLTFLPTLAYTLPRYAHFYWCFLISQWAAHALVLTRYSNVLSYLTYKEILRKEDAEKMSEPEDQAYDGIGSRSARFSINLVIAVIFCTVSPLTCLMGAAVFGICRVVYGYLLVFAEIPKPDLGGAFWVKQLHQCFVALHIYVALMFGMLLTRCGWGPAAAVLPCAFYIAWCRRHFEVTYEWEALPFEEVVVEEEQKLKAPDPEEQADIKPVVDDLLNDHGAIPKIAKNNSISTLQKVSAKDFILHSEIGKEVRYEQRELFDGTLLEEDHLSMEPGLEANNAFELKHGAL